MSASRSLFGRACGVCVCLAVLAIAFANAANAAQNVLFPSALHITRQLSDPVSQKTTTIDEYCLGNRIVSVSGTRTAIADYDLNELTEIDFAGGTYSVTKFELLARVYQQRASAPHSRRIVRVADEGESTVRGEAAEALLGIGYPYPPNDNRETLLNALRTRERGIGTNAVADEYLLPLEEIVTHDVGGEKLETRNVVVRIGHELAPPDALAIPSGATLVESKSVAARRLLEELDRPARSGN